MVRTAAAVLIALVGLALFAGPAAAQRDPFEPAIDESGVEAPSTGEEGVEEPTEEQPGREPLADTGVDSTPWLALAYVLVGLGLGVVIVAKVARPTSK